MECIDRGYKNHKLLIEDKRTKDAKKRCFQVIRNHFGNTPYLDDELVSPDNPNHLTCVEYMFNKFMDEFYHDDSLKKGKIMRLAPLFCRMVFENGYTTSDANQKILDRLKKLIKLMSVLSYANKIDLTNFDANNTTYNELNREFGKMLDNKHEMMRAIVNSKEYTPNDEYQIVGPIDYGDAKWIGEHSCPGGEICYTQDDRQWDNYTSNGDKNVYACLKHGWKDIKPVHDKSVKYNGYDEYGLSMIFVIVDENGDLSTCNTRWNHNAKYKEGYDVDDAMDEEMISDLLGRNFYDIFKPSTKFNEFVEEAMERIANGENPQDVFDNCFDFDEDFYAVNINNRYNLIHKNNNSLFGKWYNTISQFDENGLSIVTLNDEGYNLVNRNGEEICEEYYDDLIRFDEKIYKVLKYVDSDDEDNLDGYESVYNLINSKGEELFESWLKYIGPFNSNGVARITKCNEKINKCNLINSKYEIICKRWYYEIYEFFGHGFSLVSLLTENGRIFNLVNSNGEEICKKWYCGIQYFNSSGIAIVLVNNSNNELFNMINTQGEELCDEDFTSIYTIDNTDISIVTDINGNYTLINGKGKELCKRRYTYLLLDFNNIMRAEMDNKWNLISYDGQEMCKRWYDEIGYFGKHGTATAKIGNETFVIDKNGNELET